MGKVAPAKNASLTLDGVHAVHLAKIFVCDQKDTVPIWGYILRQKGLSIILEPSIKKTIDHWSIEMADLVVLDLDVDHEMRMELYQNIPISTFGVAGSHMVEKSEKLGIVPY